MAKVTQENSWFISCSNIMAGRSDLESSRVWKLILFSPLITLNNNLGSKLIGNRQNRQNSRYEVWSNKNWNMFNISQQVKRRRRRMKTDQPHVLTSRWYCLQSSSFSLLWSSWPQSFPMPSMWSFNNSKITMELMKVKVSNEKSW